MIQRIRKNNPDQWSPKFFSARTISSPRSRPYKLLLTQALEVHRVLGSYILKKIGPTLLHRFQYLNGELCEESSHDELARPDVRLDVDGARESGSLLGSTPG